MSCDELWEDWFGRVVPAVEETVVGRASAINLLNLLTRRLAPREVAALMLLSEGFSTSEVAVRLRISHTAMSKRRQQIAATAARLGVKPPAWAAEEEDNRAVA